MSSPKMPAKKPKTAAPTAIAPTGPMTLSTTAQALYDEIAGSWDLSPPVRALLRLACEAHTKAEDCEAITAREGMTIGDAKGAAKPHPMALLARDYRGQAATTLQRILSNLEG
jgi:phage terminase small subunit